MRSFLSLFGGTGGRAIHGTTGTYEQRISQFILNQVLEYTGHTIHDVINDPLVRYEVTGYYRLYRQLTRRGDQLAEQAPASRPGKNSPLAILLLGNAPSTALQSRT